MESTHPIKQCMHEESSRNNLRSYHQNPQASIGAVRPIMEYASQSAKAKLDKIQNMGLRIIGASQLETWRKQQQFNP
jgi:hypothetical protein